MSDCIFCKIVAGELPCSKIYEDDKVLSFLDIAPLSRGHTLVISKAHYETFTDMPAEAASDVAAALTRIAPAVAASQNADGYNLLLANNRCAGQVVFHVHFHIIPRNENDGIHFSWRHGSYREGEAETILADILGKLGD